VPESKGTVTPHSPDVKLGTKVKVVRLTEIAPTVLHLTGLPVPQDMDGRVLKELFKEQSEPAQSKTRYERVSTERKRVRDRVTGFKIP